MKFGIVLAVVFSALVVVLVALTVLEIHDRSQPTLMHQLQDGTLGDLMAIAVVGVMGPLYAAWRSSSRDNHSRSVAHNNN